MVKRKIGFYYVFLRETIDGVERDLSIEEGLNKLQQFVTELSPIQRKRDLFNDKFMFLDYISYDRENDGICLIQFLFKSAKHSYRAPLLDRNTVESRENPKTMAEGEQMKTHALIKIKNGDAMLFLETGNGVLTCANIVSYLNSLKNDYNSLQDNEENIITGFFCSETIARDDFREVLANMNRVTLAEVYVDKNILGSDFLNFSNPSEELKEEIVMSLKAERKRNIKQHVYNILDKFSGNTSIIKRLRIKGKLPNDNEGIIDTDFINKKEFVDAQQDNDTGEYNSAYMFSQLKTLSKDY